MTSQYKSNKSVAKNPTISIDVDDPRLSWDNIKQTFSRQGSEIDIVGLDGKSLINGGKNLTGGASGPDQNQVKKKVPKVPGVPPKGVPPKGVTNLVGAWGPNGGITLTFDFDTTDKENAFIDRFLVRVYDSGTEEWTDLKAGFGYPGSTFLNYTLPSQTLFLSAKDIDQSLDISTIISNITKVAVATADILNTGDYVEANMPAFASDLPQPEFTLSAGVDYYLVTLDPANIALAVSKGNYLGAIVEEKITTELVKANVSLTEGWQQAAPISSGTKIVVYTPDGLHRWVRIKYVKTYGEPSIYSDIKDITPDSFMPPNTDPPNQFTSGSIEWSGDDVKVNFALPTTKAPTTVKVKLVPYVNGVESPSLYSEHFHIIVPTVNFFNIKSSELYGQYGTYYSTFKGYITGLSDQGIPSDGATIVSGPISKTCSLSSIYPTLGEPNSAAPTGKFRVTPSVNGYIVDFDMPGSASRLEVYESLTPWTAIPTNDDLVVYSGLSPATIPTPIGDYDTRYIIVRYYDLYNCYSHYSMELSGQQSGKSVKPIDVGLESLITYPIKISTNGSIFSGVGDHTEYPQVFFNPAGLFAYDADGNNTTSIINDALANTPTFITENARISEWSIDKQLVGTAPNQVLVNYIQNNVYAATKIKEYAGMSSNGTYSFWAGATTSLNTDDSAEFSVKPNGEVVASKITINGNGTGGNLIYAGGGKFQVTQLGKLTAQDAIIKGTIEVDGQSYFDANVNVRNGYLIAGANGPGQGPNVQIGSAGLIAHNADDQATTKIYSSPLSVSITDAVTGTTETVDGITLWSKKVLFGSTESTGFVITDGSIKANYVTISSADQSIILRSKSSLSTKGIVLRATNDTGYAISAGNIADPSTAPFSVTTQGDLFAKNATIQGVIRAASGGFGQFADTTLSHGWTVTGSDSKGRLIATGTAEIDLSTGGVIKVGSYNIKSGGSDFSITNISSGQNILTTDTNIAGVSRIFLGQEGRQVEVSKNAEISGDYAGTAQDYRSGGLRNMYTIYKNYYNSNVFPGAGNGSVLLVYT